MKKHFLKVGLICTMFSGLLLSTVSCDKDEEVTPMVNNTPTVQEQNIAQIASSDNNFSILVDALTRTNLVDAVSDPNSNLTVFAPTNEAFQKLLTALNMQSLDEVEAALGNDGLKNILLYHVLGQEVFSSSVSTGYVKSLGTYGTENLSIYINTNSGVKLNDRATVTGVDIDASNGVIHVIDEVILPLSIFELVAVNPELSSLQTALEVADGNLDQLLTDANSNGFTLFAPNDNAFSMLLSETNQPDLNALVGVLGTDGLASVLTYHVVAGNITSPNVPYGTVTTASGSSFTVSGNGGVSITDNNSRVSNVINVDIQGNNGVIHLLDKVLLP